MVFKRKSLGDIFSDDLIDVSLCHRYITYIFGLTKMSPMSSSFLNGISILKSF